MRNRILIPIALVISVALLVALSFADQSKKPHVKKAVAGAAKVRGPGHQGQMPSQVQSVPDVDVESSGMQSQLLSSGATIGGTPSAFRLVGAGGIVVNGSVAQLAVGSGSSESFGVGSGFWQEEEDTGLRGDANADGKIDLGDAIYILNYLFKNGPDPIPMEAGDANCDGSVEIGDAIYLLNYLFKGGEAPTC